MYAKQHYVVGLAFNLDFSKLLLIRKTKPAWQAGKLNGIGGKVEQGENARDVMVREFEEECGLKTRHEDWVQLANFFSDEAVVTFFYAKLPDSFIANYTSPTEEQVLCCNTAAAMKDHSIIVNLRWLIPFATLIESAEQCGNSLTGVFT